MNKRNTEKVMLTLKVKADFLLHKMTYKELLSIITFKRGEKLKKIKF